MRQKRTVFLGLIVAILFAAPAVQADETTIFTNIAPDAMFMIDLSGSMGDKRGKGIFAIDLSNGNVLWSYTRADDAAMDYAMPAPPTMVDTDLDGFIDTAYIGDLSGNIWRFKFCSAADGSSCNTSNWTGSRFFQRAGGTGAVYASPAAAKDPKGNLWLYWGTGDRLEPITVGGGRGSHLCRARHGECRDDRPAQRRHLLEL